jgi:quercetin dioxygenase-like cupin family protein
MIVRAFVVSRARFGYTRAADRVSLSNLVSRAFNVRTLITRRDLLITTGGAPFVAAASALAGQGEGDHHALTSAEKEKQAFPFLTLTMYIETRGEETNGAVSIVRVFVPAGDGPPPHVHSREDEIHTVIRGHYRYRHADTELDAPAGTVIFMPRRVPHVFRNVGTESGEHLVTLVPAGMEKMFREVSDAKVQLPRDVARLNEIYAKYGLTNLPAASLPLSKGR